MGTITVTPAGSMSTPTVPLTNSLRVDPTVQNNITTIPTTLWRYPLSSTAVLDNSFTTYVPLDTIGNYSYFITGKFLTSRNMNRVGIGRIGTQLWNTAGAGVTKVGTWTASTPAGAYAANTYSATAGETISFVVTGSTLVSRSAASTNAGYAIVSIDGSYTLPNKLPVFTAADLASSLCRSTDVGKPYINTYHTSIAPDYHLLLADNLNDTTHTVTFEATGTKPAASSATRAYVGGVIGCSASDAAQSINGTRVVAHIIPLNDPFGIGGSAMLYTPEVETAGAVIVANTASSTTLTIASVTSGTVVVGQTVIGVGIPANTTIASFGTFTVVAGTGTVILSTAATATASELTMTTNGIYEFLGDVHGGETEEVLTVSVDGADMTTMAAGTYVTGEIVNIATQSTIASTDNTGVPVLRKKINYSYSGKNARNQLTVSFNHTWLVNKRCKSAYPLMLPIGHAKIGTAVNINDLWDRVQIDSYAASAADLNTNGGAQNGRQASLRVDAASSKHNFKASAEFLDGGRSINYFQKSAPFNVSLNDRTDGYDKVYFFRSNTYNRESFDIGDSISGVVGFNIRSN